MFGQITFPLKYRGKLFCEFPINDPTNGKTGLLSDYSRACSANISPYKRTIWDEAPFEKIVCVKAHLKSQPKNFSDQCVSLPVGQ